MHICKQKKNIPGEGLQFPGNMLQFLHMKIVFAYGENGSIMMHIFSNDRCKREEK